MYIQEYKIQITLKYTLSADLSTSRELVYSYTFFVDMLINRSLTINRVPI